MATHGSLFTPTPLGHEDNLEVRHHPRANTLHVDLRSSKKANAEASFHSSTNILQRSTQYHHVLPVNHSRTVETACS
ncbi:hypothetical protein TNCV_651261 [Trichonephila clavipes]|nr:hypothetical protein TNCV_651261 [Trichonephila clavipes]